MSFRDEHGNVNRAETEQHGCFSGCQSTWKTRQTKQPASLFGTELRRREHAITMEPRSPGNKRVKEKTFRLPASHS